MSDRESVVPEAPQEPVPAPVAITPRPSEPPPRVKSTGQLVAETLVDVLAIAGVILLAALGKIDGNVAAAVCAALAGVRLSDLIGSRGIGGGGGAGGMAGFVVGAVSLLFHRGGAQ